MIGDTEKRWPNYHPEIPCRMGMIDNHEKFDATFFGVPYKQGKLVFFELFLFLFKQKSY